MIKQVEFRPMDEPLANEIAAWRYPDPYSFYNMDEGSIEELTDGEYYAAFNARNDLIGFFCFGKTAQVPSGSKHGSYDDESALDVGLGLKPEFCGKGLGTQFMEHGLNFGKRTFLTCSFRLTVAAFNKRAIKLYESIGFKKTDNFTVHRKTGPIKFLIMVLPDYEVRF